MLRVMCCSHTLYTVPWVQQNAAMAGTALLPAVQHRVSVGLSTAFWAPFSSTSAAALGSSFSTKVLEPCFTARVTARPGAEGFLFCAPVVTKHGDSTP